MTVWFTPANGERSELDASVLRTAKRQLSNRDSDYLARLAAQDKALNPDGGWWRDKLGGPGPPRVLKRQAVAAALEAGCDRRQIAKASGATVGQIRVAIYFAKRASQCGSDPDCMPQRGIAKAILRLLHEYGPLLARDVRAHMSAENAQGVRKEISKLFTASKIEPVVAKQRHQTWRLTEKGIACLLRS